MTTPFTRIQIYTLCTFFILFLIACQPAATKEIEETSENIEEPAAPTPEKNYKLEPFEYMDCTAVAEKDTGCSCSFRPEKDDYKSDIFLSDLENTACVKINGEIVSLQGDRIDQRSELYQRSFDEHWIILNENGQHTLFGSPLKNYDYDSIRNEIIQTILVMDEFPKEIPYKSIGTVGMGFRSEIRDLCEEALTMAKEAQQKGDKGVPMQMLFQNDQFDILITGDVDGKNDSGGDTYFGKIELKNKDGKVLDSRPFWGDCNC